MLKSSNEIIKQFYKEYETIKKSHNFITPTKKNNNNETYLLKR